MTARDTTKNYKTYKGAIKYARSLLNPVILRVAGIFIVTDADPRMVDITVIDATNGRHVGNVSAHHLVRLGNANWATPVE